jgi:hypothetical protein
MGTDNNNDMLLIWGLAIFGLYALGSKHLETLKLKFTSPEFQIIFSVIVGIGFAGTIYFLYQRFEIALSKKEQERSILGYEAGSAFCGTTIDNQDVYIKPKQRAMHTQVIGTTNAGKTESVILPWAIQDIEAGRGLILIDGKADRSLLDKLWSYTVKAGRQKDFRLFSLGNIESGKFQDSCRTNLV